MVRGRKFVAARVYETVAQHQVRFAGRSERAPPPPWFAALKNIAPSEVLTRPYPIQHTAPQDRGSRVLPPRHLFRPTAIVHPEDQLRSEFFRDHPWELARPRVILELDGQDARHVDWSRGLRQPGMPLSGESVVQRQLWLMEVKGLSKAAAYDQARKEFYKLRHQEEIERRIAAEEARMYGAYFGKTNLQVGMQLEDASYNQWKKWAADEIARIEAERVSAYANVVDVDTAKDVDADLEEEADAVAA